MNLRPYQAEAVSALTASLRDGGRAQCVMACGTGKTVVEGALIDALKPHSVAILAPTIELLIQLAEQRAQPGAIVVCTPSEIRRDEGPWHVTTDQAVLIDLIRCAAKSSRVEIYCTYASSLMLGRALTASAITLDLAIADEAHRSTGEDGLYSGWLDDAIFPARRRAFFTATPRAVGGGRWGRRLWSMDDEDAFGPRVYTYSFAEAMRDGWVCDFEVAVPIVDAALDKNEAVAAGIIRSRRDLGVHRLLSFHSRVRDAIAVAAILRARGENAIAVSGRDDRAAIKSVRRALANEADITVCNARLFAEGIDVPALDAVAFAADIASPVTVAQQVGRAIRTAPGKTRGYVILPPTTAGDATDLANPSAALRLLAALYDLRQPDDKRWIYGQQESALRVRAVADTTDAASSVSSALRAAIDLYRLDLRTMLAERYRSRIEAFLADFEAGGRAADWPREYDLVHRGVLCPPDLLERWERAKAQRSVDRNADLRDYIDKVAMGTASAHTHPKQHKALAGGRAPKHLIDAYASAIEARSSARIAELSAYLDRLEAGTSDFKEDARYYTTMIDLRVNVPKDLRDRFSAIRARQDHARRERAILYLQQYEDGAVNSNSDTWAHRWLKQSAPPDLRDRYTSAIMRRKELRRKRRPAEPR